MIRTACIAIDDLGCCVTAMAVYADDATETEWVNAVGVKVCTTRCSPLDPGVAVRGLAVILGRHWAVRETCTVTDTEVMIFDTRFGR